MTLMLKETKSKRETDGVDKEERDRERRRHTHTYTGRSCQCVNDSTALHKTRR